MTLTGIVRGNSIVLTSGGPLPEGAKILIEAVVEPGNGQLTSDPVQDSPDSEPDELTRQLLDLSGSVQGLPADASAQLDHYLYGSPKQ